MLRTRSAQLPPSSSPNGHTSDSSPRAPTGPVLPAPDAYRKTAQELFNALPAESRARCFAFKNTKFQLKQASPMMFADRRVQFQSLDGALRRDHLVSTYDALFTSEILWWMALLLVPLKDLLEVGLAPHRSEARRWGRTATKRDIVQCLADTDSFPLHPEVVGHFAELMLAQAPEDMSALPGPGHPASPDESGSSDTPHEPGSNVAPDESGSNVSPAPTEHQWLPTDAVIADAEAALRRAKELERTVMDLQNVIADLQARPASEGLPLDDEEKFYVPEPPGTPLTSGVDEGKESEQLRYLRETERRRKAADVEARTAAAAGNDQRGVNELVHILAASRADELALKAESNGDRTYVERFRRSLKKRIERGQFIDPSSVCNANFVKLQQRCIALGPVKAGDTGWEDVMSSYDSTGWDAFVEGYSVLSGMWTDFLRGELTLLMKVLDNFRSFMEFFVSLRKSTKTGKVMAMKHIMFTYTDPRVCDWVSKAKDDSMFLQQTFFEVPQSFQAPSSATDRSFPAGQSGRKKDVADKRKAAQGGARANRDKRNRGNPPARKYKNVCFSRSSLTSVCKFHDCRFSHICVSCGDDHAASDCPAWDPSKAEARP
jgi:hypothetical protein